MKGLARWSWAIETFLALLPDSGLVAVGGGEELTPKLSFTGSWAAWEPQRRWVRSSCRVERADRLAANIVWSEAIGDNR